MKNKGTLKLEKAILTIFWSKTLKDSKVSVAKDHGTKFQSKLAASFSAIILSNLVLSLINHVNTVCTSEPHPLVDFRIFLR